MSYILDALKKSEKERQKRTAPDPLEIHDYIAHETKNRRPVWAYVLSLVVILNIGLLFYWMNPWQEKKAATGGISSDERSVASDHGRPSNQPTDDNRIAVIEEKDGEPESKLAPVEKARQPVPLNEKGGSLQAAVPAGKMKERPAPPVERERSHAAAEAKTQHVAQAAPVSPDQKSETQAPTPDANRIYAVSELPLSIQQSLPAFTISAFLYSDDPATRMVRVNGKMLREGDVLAEGLKLNEIRQNELIFGYQNYRMRLGIK